MLTGRLEVALILYTLAVTVQSLQVGVKPKTKFWKDRPDRDDYPTTPQEIHLRLIEDKVIPDVISTAPKDFLKVEYKSQAKINFGQLIRCADTTDPPVSITWPVVEGDYYTLLLTDRDASLEIPPIAPEWQHWMVVNIHGSNWKEGDVRTAYMGAFIPNWLTYDTGPHRYVFTLWRQKNGVTKFQQKFIHNLNMIVFEHSKNTNHIAFELFRLASVWWWSEICMSYKVHSKLTEVERDLLFQKAFKKSQIVPDVLDAVPWDELEVEYNNGTVDLGNTLVVHQVWRKPGDVLWPKIKGAFYSLIFLAPDHPNPENPRFREYVLWLVVNIRDGELNEGEVLAEYIMPPPPEKIGRQRYVFLIFQQKPTGRQKIVEPFIPPIPEDQVRANFSTRRFVEKYDLEENPSAGNFFYIDWGVTV